MLIDRSIAPISARSLVPHNCACAAIPVEWLVETPSSILANVAPIAPLKGYALGEEHVHRQLAE